MIQFFHKKNNSKGFTLIELLVVIAIIGILATIVLVSLNTARQKARDSRRIGDIRQVALALELYFDDNTAYPATVGTTPAARWADLSNALKTGGYMTNVPNDPGTASYDYQDGNSSQDYVLSATLENANNSALDSDVDGIVFNIDCTDPNYCIQP